ncbi:insulin-like growth factor-binding protein 7 [Megalops cyprinoides]|uniref:insulin-like growth factor-binding protein 7 n=1 Tax=Megalops cyprinoides TaxID=118141 RepID=UPI001864696F|nr:insulin-like growth factor-binding protein 7 [Megalops cyprinoides]
MLTLFVLVVSLTFTTAASGRVARSCGTCEISKCAPLPTEGCKFGAILDGCGCCEVCAAGLGEPCGGRGASAKRCASGMECVKNEEEKNSKLGICVCKSDYEVCGTDGVTYKTGCDLKGASLKAVSEEKPEIKVLNKGKCAQAPVIVTPPKEIWNVTGSQVFLSCEAIGVPTPIVTWKKISPNTKGKAALLPGDRDNLAVQTRGGPEKHEVTGWVLISPLTEADGGSYECHAMNAKGEASAVGSIHVVASIDDIPTKKANEDEL